MTQSLISPDDRLVARCPLPSCDLLLPYPIYFRSSPSCAWRATKHMDADLGDSLMPSSLRGVLSELYLEEEPVSRCLFSKQ